MKLLTDNKPSSGSTPGAVSQPLYLLCQCTTQLTMLLIINSRLGSLFAIRIMFNSQSGLINAVVKSSHQDGKMYHTKWPEEHQNMELFQLALTDAKFFDFIIQTIFISLSTPCLNSVQTIHFAIFQTPLSLYCVVYKNKRVNMRVNTCARCG